MLYKTKQPLFYENLQDSYNQQTEAPEYAIYIYISDHLRRIYEAKYGIINIFLDYKQKDNHLIERKMSILTQLNRSYIVRKFMSDIIFTKYMLNKRNDNQNFNLVKLYFEESRNELRKKYPNIK